jgi:translation initiation factor 2 alpha subunit (eIF-2alpha)
MLTGGEIMTKPPLTKAQAKKRDAILLEIAKEELFLETLEVRGWDTWDFHEHGVLNIRDALRKAYEAGRQSVK